MVRTMFYLISLLLVAGLASASRGRSINVKGGLGAVIPIDDEAREAFNAVKNEVAAKYSVIKAPFKVDVATLIPEEYAKQTVAGTMFFIRMRVTNWMADNYIHAKVLRDIQGHFTLQDTEQSDAATPLRFF